MTDGSGRDRTTLRRALELLSAAGYELRGTELVERRSGKPLTFEIMVANRTETMDEERLARIYASNLKRAGITARVRLVDAVQFETRRIAFDFDMIQNRWDQSLSPGNEQAFYWSSAAADRERQPQLHGRQEPGRRRHDRSPGQGADACRRGRGGARARPRADLGLLHGAAVPSARPLGRALDHHGPSRAKLRSWAISPKPGGVRRNKHHHDPRRSCIDQDSASRIGGRATLDDLFRRARNGGPTRWR